MGLVVSSVMFSARDHDPPAYALVKWMMLTRLMAASSATYTEVGVEKTNVQGEGVQNCIGSCAAESPLVG